MAVTRAGNGLDSPMWDSPMGKFPVMIPPWGNPPWGSPPYRQVFICKEFCEETYEHCATAKLGEKILGEEYSSGTELCQAQSFQVIPSRERCFNFDPDAFDSAVSAGLSVFVAVVSLAAVAVFGR